MARADPHAQRQGTDREAHRRHQQRRLAIAPGVDLSGRRDLDRGGGPRSLGRARGRPVEHQDAKPTGVEPRTRLHGDPAIDRVGVVGDHHDRGLAMLGAAVVDDGEPRCRRARSQCFLRGGQQRLQPRVAVALLPHRLGVEAEDHVVDEDRSVDLADVDAALETVREGLQRPDDVAALHTEIAREVVSGARGNARERQVVRARGRCDDRHRAVAAGHAERIGPPVHRVGHERCEIVVGLEDDRLDAELPRALRQRQPNRRAAARSGIDEEHGSARPRHRLPPERRTQPLARAHRARPRRSGLRRRRATATCPSAAPVTEPTTTSAG